MMPEDVAVLRQHLKRDEGLRLLPYDDRTGLPLKRGDVLQGVLTIGYGRAIGLNGISQLEADAMLNQDIARHLSDLHRAFPQTLELDSVRHICLAEMCFNLGVVKLGQFKRMWNYIKRHNWEGAAEEMMASRWSEQTGPRATRLAEAMRSGEFK